MSADPDEVPKLPRGRGLKFSKPELLRIGLTLLTLIGVIMLTGPCANAVSGFVTGFDDKGSAASSMPKPGTVDQPQPAQFEEIRPGMTDDEIKAVIERSRARAAGAAAVPSGSAAAGSDSTTVPSGSAAAGSGSTTVPSGSAAAGSAPSGSGATGSAPSGSAATGSASSTGSGPLP